MWFEAHLAEFQDRLDAGSPVNRTRIHAIDTRHLRTLAGPEDSPKPVGQAWATGIIANLTQ